ncbi:sigma-54-dependent transcriptional regulator [Clostridium uliginosum]|uniref:Transcriptional regulator containing an AAA-type ATPase domain and a DNA-binding domain n=1 Tax=Clostridium uliginosum TaxID=119641 RepID=A0A1I1QH24_9CLOT|nr:sigma 54-interacting transcriptional regulator [Clostridium uliginosum]SFD21464.1 Transcriptional regulator containing an AAA-type ATPase domain and a DNA-binding domain [Clostridium uliginosum]
MYDNYNEEHKINRKDRVNQKLKQLTREIIFDNNNLSKKIGFEASYLAKELNISRNNVSKELNCILNEGKAVKILGKPVLYLDKEYLEATCGIIIEEPIIKKYDELKEIILKALDLDTVRPKDKVENKKKTNDENKSNEKKNLVYETGNSSSNKKNKDEDIFDNIIGSEDSLKTQIKQAKATILYPPNGLHTLLIGPTGVGKTTFAEVMYRYAIGVGRLKPNASYVIFNCADYAENSQLLLSHLFGHVKGAFTGADSEKKGLVDQANGGILFLDEVHRLPPEGQEMLFSLMDRGSYRRLGEAESTREATILFIAATTEDPEASILSTFLRRIPVTIKLPSLSKRSLKERMKLICQFLKNECVKIKAPLKVSKEVLKVLLLYKCPGNIGQLKNDIQLICANAFVEYITEDQEYVHVKLSQISQKFKEGLFTIEDKRQELMQCFNLNEFESITFDSSGEDLGDNLNGLLLYDEYNTEEDFYDLMLERAQKFYEGGFSVNQIRENISSQIQHRFNNIPSTEKSRNLMLDKEVLSKIVTPEIVDIIKDSFWETSDELGKSIDTKLIYSLALHMETLIERLRLGNISIYPNLEITYKQHKEEFAIAERIKIKLQEKFSIQIPNDEVAFITMFLYSVNTKKEHGNIQVLVIAHGNATATNMVDVAKTLLGYNCLHALDMPLEEKVEFTLNKATDIVKKINKGSGVLLLVDMGSLTTFSDVITEKTGILTKTIKMVSTPMVIEAGRKAMTPNVDMDMLIESVNSVSSLIGERVKLNNAPIKINYQNMNCREYVVDMLDDVLTFLNVKKASKTLNEILDKISLAYNQKIDDGMYIKFLFHCSCMIERVIRNEPLPYKKFSEIKNTKEELFNAIKDNFVLAEEVFGISIPDTELAYVVEMIDINFNVYSTNI